MTSARGRGTAVAPLSVAADHATILRIRSFAKLTDGWNGPRSRAPGRLAIEAALTFIRGVAIRPDSVAPTDDAEIMFEWDFADGDSLLAHVANDTIYLVLLGREDNEYSRAPTEAAALANRVVAMHA